MREPMSPSTPRKASSLALVALALVAFASCGPADGSKWSTLEPPDGAFSVAMPGTPKLNRQVASGQAGSFDSNVYTLDLEGGGFFTVAEARLPEHKNTNDEASALLESACDHVVGSASAKLDAKQTIYLAGHEGRRVEGTVPDTAVDGGATLRGRIYLA